MPEKGMFTASACVLLERPVTLDEMERALSGFTIAVRQEGSDKWVFGGPSLVLPFRPEVNGHVAVDLIDRPWPDSMGDPKQDATLFGAWAMGQFGPFTYPQNLHRALQQAWACPEAETLVPRHQAVLRIRASYVFGSADDAPVMPPDYDSMAEMEFVTDVAADLLELPGALCYFNPNGETLCTAARLRESREQGEARNMPPLDVWTNVRLFRVEEQWTLMDTVGNGQLDLPDLEACFAHGSQEPGRIEGFLRNLTLYVLGNPDAINDGDTLEGGDGCYWQVQSFTDSLVSPPRRVLRWAPCTDEAALNRFLQPRDEEETPT